MLNRSLEAYRKCEPHAVSGGSQAQMAIFVEDAKADIEQLGNALRLCHSALVTLISPDKEGAVIHAFCLVVEAEERARSALASAHQYAEAAGAL